MQIIFYWTDPGGDTWAWQERFWYWILTVAHRGLNKIRYPVDMFKNYNSDNVYNLSVLIFHNFNLIPSVTDLGNSTWKFTKYK